MIGQNKSVDLQFKLEGISGHCGYQDVSSFSKIFKRWAQLTPKEYRTCFGLRN